MFFLQLSLAYTKRLVKPRIKNRVCDPPGKIIKSFGKVLPFQLTDAQKRVLREITGDPDAPIPQLVKSMQQLTGGKFQQMQPGQMQGMLLKIRETARASNIAMDVMMETLVTASQQHQAMGGSGLGGAQMDMSA